MSQFIEMFGCDTIKKSLCEICRPKQWPTIQTKDFTEDGYLVYGANGVIGHYNEYNHKYPTILMACRGASCGAINVSEPESYITGNAMCLDDLSDEVCFEFLVHFLTYYDYKTIISGGAQPQITITSLQKIEIPIPPKKEQEKFVAIARQADKSEFGGSKSQFIEMFKGDFPIERWEECLSITNGKKYDGEYQQSGTYPICGSGGIMGYGDQKLCQGKTVILGRKGNINSPIFMKSEYWIVDTAFCLDVDIQKLHPKYFYYWCKQFDFTRYNKQGVLPSLTKNDLLKIEMPIPPMELQVRFVNIIEQADKSEYDCYEVPRIAA
jgi:type I restriction enzyme S subunit